MYGEEVRQLTAEAFQKWENEIPEKVTNKEGVKHKVWIVSALLCAVWYINAARYLPGHTTLKIEWVNKAWENNV